MSSTSSQNFRSRTGCLTCKIRRKKCDETRPGCQRCQRSGLECPGYLYVEDMDKKVKRLRTQPGLRTTKTPLAQALLTKKTQSGTPQTVPNDVTSGHPIGPLTDEATRLNGQHPSHSLSAFSGDVPDLSFLSNASPIALFGLLDLTKSWWDHNPTLTAQNEMSLETLMTHQQLWDYQLPRVSSDMPSSSAGGAVPMTSGQASLLQALFSLGRPQDPPMHPINLTDTSISNSSGSVWQSPDNEKDETESVTSDEDPEGISEKLCKDLVLDKTAESNSLPFVLQSYATWVAQTVFEPLRMLHIARDFVFQHFSDGEDSRWTVTLLANVVRSLGPNIEPVNRDYAPVLSLLRHRVSHRLAMAMSTFDPRPPKMRHESIAALDATFETVIIHFYTSPLLDVRRLLQEAAPLFRQLCPDPPGTPINLPTLLLQPLVSLRRFAHVDIFFNLTLGLPMSFRYDYDFTSFTNHTACGSFVNPQEDIGIQWLYGTPDRFTVLFAKMSAMREDGCTIDEGTVAEIEREIREFKPLQTTSPDSFLMVARLVVQECWRQAAYVFLYMGVCGDSSDTTRVKEALKRFMKLLNKTKPGRVPDNFLIVALLIVSPAARRNADREAIRRRVYTLQQWICAATSANDRIPMIEEIWARSDAEGRPIFWSDVAISRVRVLGS